MQMEMSLAAKVHLCDQQYGAKTNASNLACHVQRVHLKKYAAFSKGFDAKNQKEVEFTYNPMDSDGVENDYPYWMRSSKNKDG